MWYSFEKLINQWIQQQQQQKIEINKTTNTFKKSQSMINIDKEFSFTILIQYKKYIII